MLAERWSNGLGRGERVGRFRIERPLGTGGMGRVFGAVDELLGRRVAIKLLHSGDPSMLVDEARALAALSCPNVVNVYELCETSHGLVVVMEWIEGTSADLLLEAGPIAPTRAAAIVRAAGSGLTALHEAGWIHGDVKPSNLLIERSTGRVVLADLGLAQRIEMETDGPYVRGTPSYLAPEAAAGEKISLELRARRDVYALAVTAFELLTGQLPYDGADLKRILLAQICDPIPRVDELAPELGWRVHRAIARGLAKRPADRTATPRAFAEELARALMRRRQPVRLLVVDDESADREAFAESLARRFRGCVVEAVSDGETGFHAAASTSPDLAIVDLSMPYMNGIELVAALRATEGLEHLPVIVVSGSLGRREREVLAGLGVTRVLEKPVVLRALAHHVRELLELPGDSGSYPKLDRPRGGM